jgi:signal transduction histidine kinase
LRERKLQEASYMQAVHETGARLTHDVKNLLQSLDALCSVVESEAKSDSPDLLALVRRQLPAISKRLAKTLERLRKPETEAVNWVAAAPWWKSLQALYRSEGIEFSAEGVEAGVKVPGALFESVADNLIRNALAKRETDPGVRIAVGLRCGERLELRVADTGAAVPAELAEKMLRGPVPSRRGMGIGLYQAARQAQENGFTLGLERNAQGDVCFALRGEGGGGVTASLAGAPDAP